MKKIIFFALLMIIGCCTRLCAQKPGVVISDKDGWHKIGQTVVDFSNEREEILVIGADRFGFIKINHVQAKKAFADAGCTLHLLEIGEVVQYELRIGQ